MISKLYKNPNYGFPLISFILLLTCTIVTIPTAFQNEIYYVFSLNSKPFYFWQVFSGIFEHSIFPNWFIWPHFLGNMSIVILFGILIERVLGSNKMLLLTSLGAVSYVLFFHIRFKGQIQTGSGASGIVYAFAPVALYIIWKFIKSTKYNYAKDILFYILGFEFIFIWGFITAVSSWNGTNIYHVIATMIGIFFLITFKKQISLNLDYILTIDRSEKKEPRNKWIYFTFLIPLSMIAILFLYTSNHLNDLFIEPISISSYDTIQDIINNNNEIEIIFEKPITKFSYVYTSGIDSSKITYSEDGKILRCIFKNGLHHPYEIHLCSAYDTDGRVVKDISIFIKK